MVTGLPSWKQSLTLEMIRWICVNYASILICFGLPYWFLGCRWMARMIHFAALLPIVSIINKESYKHPFPPPPQKPEMKSNHLSDLRGNVLKITYIIFILHRIMLCNLYMLYSVVFDYTVLQYILSYCVLEHRPVYSMIY